MEHKSRVQILEGPQNYEILQQEDGAADITLSGIYLKKGIYDSEVTSGSFRVMARVLLEDNFQPIVPWTEGEALEDSTFRITLHRVPAGGPYTIETALMLDDILFFDWARAGDRVRHIGVGDVYAIAGQSNAVGYGKEPVYDPPERGVHALMADGVWDIACHPLSDNTRTLHPENADDANTGVSPYLAFAKELKRALGYPIGLVPAAIGGVPLSTWNPDEDGIYYRTLMGIVQRHHVKLKGMLWYQGCTDTDHPELPETYVDRFANMVRRLREDTGNSALPLLTVQINRATDEGARSRGLQWSKIRQAQRRAAQEIPGVYVVPSIDCPLSDNIHNSSAGNLMLGMRMAQCALKHVYGRPNLPDAPDLYRAKYVGGSCVELQFQNVGEALWCHDMPADVLPFEVQDETGKIVPIVSYQEDGARILLHLSREIHAGSVVHSYVGADPLGIPPVDRMSRLPILAFYNAPVLFETV